MYLCKQNPVQCFELKERTVFLLFATDSVHPLCAGLLFGLPAERDTAEAICAQQTRRLKRKLAFLSNLYRFLIIEIIVYGLVLYISQWLIYQEISKYKSV